MQIESIDGDAAVVHVAGTRRKISVALLEGPSVGDYVLVHAGFAIKKIDEAHAAETIELLNESGLFESRVPRPASRKL